MAKEKAYAVVVNMLDEVAWLFNLRGSDIDHNPGEWTRSVRLTVCAQSHLMRVIQVFFAHALIMQTKSILYISPDQLSDPRPLIDDNHLPTDVEFRPYDAILDDLRTLAGSLGPKPTGKVLVGNKASLVIVDTLGEDRVSLVRSPVADAKSIKNETEMYGFRQSHLRDGVALVRYPTALR